MRKLDRFIIGLFLVTVSLAAVVASIYRRAKELIAGFMSAPVPDDKA